MCPPFLHHRDLLHLEADQVQTGPVAYAPLSFVVQQVSHFVTGIVTKVFMDPYPGHLLDNSHGPPMIENLGLPMIEDVPVSI